MGLIQDYVDKRVANFFDNIDLKTKITGKIYNDDLYELQENRIWYKANKDTLLRFYKTTRRVNQLYPIQDFYRLTPGNIPIQHYPLADMITKTMVNLVFSEKPTIAFETGNQQRDEELNKILEEIYDDNNISSLIQNAAELESYSGAVAFKPVLDPDFSDYPIIMAYPKEDFEVIKKYNRIQGIIFKDYYKKDKKEYVLYTECGIGYITYKLYEMEKNSQEGKDEVPLSTLPETKGLKPLKFRTSDGKPLRQLLAVYKENKTNATSDYSGIIDDFQALDEIYTNMVNYIRKSKVKVYMPENMCKKNEKGETIVPFDYDSDYTILYDNNPEGTSQEAKRDVIDIQNTIVGYREAFNEVLKHAVLNTGLSLSSIGYDISGANASGEALAIREKVSMRTRSEKIRRWDEALQSLTRLVVALQSYTVVGDAIHIENMFDYNVLVSFAEYEEPTMDAIVEVLANTLEAGLIDRETALHRLWDDEYSNEEIEIMLKNIEIERANMLPDEPFEMEDEKSEDLKEEE